MKTWLGAILGVCLLSMSPALPQNKPPQKVDQKKIDAAIEKGVKYLSDRLDGIKKGTIKGDQYHVERSSLELLLYTFVHAGVPASDERVKSLLGMVLAELPTQKETYNLALEAMALSMIDRKTFQNRMSDLAQAIIDTQCRSGGWGYNIEAKPLARRRKQLPKEVPLPSFKAGDRGKTDIVKKIERKGWGNGGEDNS